MPVRRQNYSICPICSIRVTQVGIKCDACRFWIHQHCAGLSDDDYKSLSCQNVSWSCPGCTKLNQPTETATLVSPHVSHNSIDAVHLQLQQLAKDIDHQKITSLRQADELERMRSTLEKVNSANTALVTENVRLRENVGNLAKEVQTLQDLCAYSAAKSGELESQIQDTSWKTVLECTQVLNRQRNLIITNVPEEFQPSTALRMSMLRETLRAVFQSIGITNPFPYIKRHQRLGVFTGTRPRSVVVEFTTTEARDLVLSKAELLKYSKLSYIGIVPDTPNPQKHQVAPIPKLIRRCSVVVESHLVPATSEPQSQATTLHETAQQAPDRQLGETLEPPIAPNPVPNAARPKNGERPHRPPVTRDHVRLVTSKSSTQMRQACEIKSTSFATVPVRRHRMSLRSRKRGDTLS